jgi:hypothetical protein
VTSSSEQTTVGSSPRRLSPNRNSFDRRPPPRRRTMRTCPVVCPHSSRSQASAIRFMAETSVRFHSSRRRCVPQFPLAPHHRTSSRRRLSLPEAAPRFRQPPSRPRRWQRSNPIEVGSAAPRRPSELAAPVRHLDLRACLPSSIRPLVPSGELRADLRSLAFVPPTGLAHWAPRPHLSDIRHHVVELLGRAVDED